MSLRPVVGAVAALLTLLALAAPAVADSETFGDPRGDTSALMRAGGVVAPAAKRADILRTFGAHAGGRMTMRLTMAAVGPGNLSVQGRLATDEGNTYTVSLFRNDGITERALIQDDVGTVDCPGLEISFQPRRDTITMSVPRPCLSLPTWIRFGAWVNAWQGQVTRTDDARRDGRADGPVALGRRMLRHN